MKSDLGFNIYKVYKGDGYMSLWFLGPNNKRILRKDHARTFYHREDAVACLVVMRKKDEGEEST